jgi:phospholysine phosphohistidine inorganic pyrophosphate phosphatase
LIDRAMAALGGSRPPVKALLVDIAGVLHVDWTPIPRSIAAVARLRRELPGRFRFLTNTDTLTRAALVDRLTRIGFEGVTEDEVITSGHAARSIVERRKLVPHLVVHPDIADEFKSLPVPSPDTPANCVLLTDCEEHIDYAKLNEAFRVLVRDPEAVLVATGGARFYRAGDGQLNLDVGSFAHMLEYAAGRECMITSGKPSAEFFGEALEELGVAAEEVRCMLLRLVCTSCRRSISRCELLFVRTHTKLTSRRLFLVKTVMIGDDVLSDVGGAQRAGIRGVLVRTGKFSAGDETRDDVTPFAVVDDFSAGLDLLL